MSRAPLHPSITPSRVERLARENMYGLSNHGICRACGETQDGCEPDARQYECHACGAAEVDGADEFLFEVAS